MRVTHAMTLAAVLLGLSAATPAAAATAVAAPGTTNLRAGPSTSYPVVARIRGGSVVNLAGCLQDFSWCKGTVAGDSGWMFARRLGGLHTQRTGDSAAVITFQPREVGVERRRVRRAQAGRILGEVTDRPGYCYALDGSGNSVVVRCRGGGDEDGGPGESGRILGEVTDRPGYCYALDDRGNSVIVRCD